MKYLFWVLLTAVALEVLAVETYICKWVDDDYKCDLIKDDSSDDIQIKSIIDI